MSAEQVVFVNELDFAKLKIGDPCVKKAHKSSKTSRFSTLGYENGRLLVAFENLKVNRFGISQWDDGKNSRYNKPNWTISFDLPENDAKQLNQHVMDNFFTKAYKMQSDRLQNGLDIPLPSAGIKSIIDQRKSTKKRDAESSKQWYYNLKGVKINAKRVPRSAGNSNIWQVATPVRAIDNPNLIVPLDKDDFKGKRFSQVVVEFKRMRYQHDCVRLDLEVVALQVNTVKYKIYSNISDTAKKPPSPDALDYKLATLVKDFDEKTLRVVDQPGAFKPIFGKNQQKLLLCIPHCTTTAKGLKILEQKRPRASLSFRLDPTEANLLSTKIDDTVKTQLAALGHTPTEFIGVANKFVRDDSVDYYSTVYLDLTDNWRLDPQFFSISTNASHDETFEITDDNFARYPVTELYITIEGFSTKSGRLIYNFAGLSADKPESVMDLFNVMPAKRQAF